MICSYTPCSKEFDALPKQKFCQHHCAVLFHREVKKLETASGVRASVIQRNIDLERFKLLKLTSAHRETMFAGEYEEGIMV